jgi:hypothetical protein
VCLGTRCLRTGLAALNSSSSRSLATALRHTILSSACSSLIPYLRATMRLAVKCALCRHVICPTCLHGNNSNHSSCYCSLCVFAICFRNAIAAST